MRKFILVQKEAVKDNADGSTLFNETELAEGVILTGGKVVVHWLGSYQSVVVWDSIFAFTEVSLKGFTPDGDRTMKFLDRAGDEILHGRRIKDVL